MLAVNICILIRMRKRFTSNVCSAVIFAAFVFLSAPPVLCQGSTVLPTDTLPLPTRHKGPSYVKLNAHEVRILDRLPAKFFLNVINESSLRLETNPYQDPPKYSLLNFLLRNQVSSDVRTSNESIQEQLSQVNATQQVFREAPNITAGWQFTPRLSVYSNYFMIRDSLFHSSNINSTSQSVGGGVQYDMPIGKHCDLQPNLQFREFYQTGQPDVFDYMPAITLTRDVGEHTYVYANSILQLRGLQPFVAPNREIDPFYTIGSQTIKGVWQLTSSGTFFQNFRKPFGANAYAPVNGYGIICDFEIARQISRKYQGLQAFLRAEPVFNFHSSAYPSLSGFDFRLFYGIRLSLTKPALTGPMQQLREQLLRQPMAL